ncbi:MAG: energy transducer TonB [Saprospiraceae bacterium]|nr:energy transducer TonB [Saprospiraceae bacterium]
MLLFISLFAFQIADNEGDKQSPTETQKTDKARNVILKECLQASSISDEQLKCTKEIISKIYRSHLVYPQEAVNKKIEGTVIISITYNPDGSIEYQILKDDKEHVLSSKLTDFIMALKSLEVDIESLGLRTIFYPVFFDLDGQTNSQFIPDDALIVTAQGVINKITPNNNDNKNNILTPDTLSGGQIPTDQSVAINIQKVDKSSSGTKENGEVRVTAGNIVLKVGIDYIVNYETGKVKIISDKYQKSNLPVSVEFMPNTDQRSAQNDSLLLFFSATTPDSGRIEAYTHNNSKEEKPLIKYFDHKEIPIEKPAFITDDNLLTGEFIDRVSVMKGKSAIEKYGPQATGGVIEIYLKDGFKVENLKNSAPKQESEGPINLRVYPNPAYDHLNVSLQSNKQKIRIRYYLTDLTGKKILSGKEREVNGLINFEVDVISLPNGSYYFVLDDGNDRYQRAIQISR